MRGSLKWGLLPECSDELYQNFRVALGRFGADPKELSGYLLVATSRSMYLLRAVHNSQIAELILRTLAGNSNRLSYIGLPAFHRTPSGWKPTTRFAQSYPQLFRRNLIKFKSLKTLKRFVESYPIELPSPEVELMDASDGWVIARYGEDVIGAGLLRNNVLRGHIPKMWRGELLSFL